LEQFKRIKAGSPFFEMAKTNIRQLERNRE
jgi:hypothetical protein